MVVRVYFVRGRDGVESVGYLVDLLFPYLLEFTEVVPVEGSFGIAIGVGLFHAVGVDEKRLEMAGGPNGVPFFVHREFEAAGERRDPVRTFPDPGEGILPDGGTVVNTAVPDHVVAEGVVVGNKVFVRAEYGLVVGVYSFFRDLGFHLVEKFG